MSGCSCIYILDAPLAVNSETWQDGSSACPGQTRERAEYNESVVQTLLVPGMEQAVNISPEYADLRRVYLSRVAAEWYRLLSDRQDTQYEAVIGSGIVGPWVSRDEWDPKDVFDEYVSIVNGSTGSIEIDGVTYELVYGGADFAEAPSSPNARRGVRRELAAATRDRR